MNRLFVTRPLLKTGIVGLLLIPFLALINEFSPPKEVIPQGYSSSILAFEFATDYKEVVEVLDPLSREQIEDLDRLNYVDFGFMMMYGIFLFLFMSRLSQVLEDGRLKLVRWLAPIIVISDALENVQLLKLSRDFLSGGSSGDNILTLLAFFTWMKWLLLAIVFDVIAYGLWKRKGLNWVSILLLIPLFLGIIAFINSSRKMEDIFATSVFFGFFVLFIYSFIYRAETK